MTEPLTDANPVRAAGAGDRTAFCRLVEQAKRPVYGLCLRLLGEAEEARDAAQETFVRAWAALGTFDLAQPFAPWVLRIARNHCIDLVRRRLPAGRKLELDAQGEGDYRTELADASAPRADDALERSQLASTLDAAVFATTELAVLGHLNQVFSDPSACSKDAASGAASAPAAAPTYLLGRSA